jgi:glucose-6-phosphate isomerase
MTLYEPIGCQVDPATGVLSNATGKYEKRFVDLEGLYADVDAYAVMKPELSDTVVYDVHEFRPSDATGDLIFGVTRMSPGKVGREYFMTRGHIHRIADRPEIYYGQQGSGLMLMESPAGEIRIVEVGPQTICYVPPFWIHRSVNTGPTDFVMVFSYPADSGQDYDIIARAGGMRSRIVDDGDGGWIEESNRFYRPRDPETVAAYSAR